MKPKKPNPFRNFTLRRSPVAEAAHAALKEANSATRRWTGERGRDGSNPTRWIESNADDDVVTEGGSR